MGHMCENFKDITMYDSVYYCIHIQEIFVPHCCYKLKCIWFIFLCYILSGSSVNLVFIFLIKKNLFPITHFYCYIFHHRLRVSRKKNKESLPLQWKIRMFESHISCTEANIRMCHIIMCVYLKKCNYMLMQLTYCVHICIYQVTTVFLNYLTSLGLVKILMDSDTEGGKQMTDCKIKQNVEKLNFCKWKTMALKWGWI